MNYDTRITADADRGVTSSLEGYGQAEGSSRRKWLVIGGLAAAILAIVAFLLLTGNEAPVGDDRSQAPTVTVVVPGRTTIDAEINATGTIAARREMPVGVVGEGGRVVSVPVEQGQWVRAGQVLASIDRSVQSQQARSASAQVQVAQADAQLAQSNLDRALQLVERGFISKADVDRLTATRDAARARVEVARAQYNELLARNARLNIVAPASGLLLERNVEPGQVVGGASGTLFRIAKGGEMELMARVGEGDLVKLAPGVQAEVSPVGVETAYTGQVWQVEPTIDPQSRLGVARVALSYAPGLRPGGFAKATIKSGTVVAPMLPESAILSDSEGSYVYIIGKDDKVERRGVTTGFVSGSGVAVTQGLNGTERVVLRAGGFLNEGESVNPKLEKASGE
ncbi:efflux RND transporter periplasmic adaptor subunit [Altererythrobacter arenosus]|uniref:Efflux RND transporter periplasmic adaptor subunit n=1 Tax=Altererythrobacter arenosus TaxID=3032592 RepID=A0ABY8FUR0_9SPHN|nr:efflux RND transporter periplasmic adaptor subunit [Altererythrobacter sp. CAU 1644]WFL78746.1 efflux RND transporter periplasmic adaptor subunit [Altererythrobacter sp. CAU 1644]